MATGLFRITGVALIALGSALFTLLGLHLGDVSLPALADLGMNGIAYYLGATAGSVTIGWGVILIAAARRPEMRFPVGLGSGIGFLALAFMRLWAALSATTDLESVAPLLPWESLLFFAIAIGFFEVSFGFGARLLAGYRSLRAAPGWVQVWVWSALLPVNMAGIILYGLTQHPLPGWMALGFAFVVIVNMALVLYERGISKLTSLPHLIPWVPLQIYTGLWLFVWGGLSPTLTVFAWLYFIVIGISNVFDAYDTWRWFRGERAVMGHA